MTTKLDFIGEKFKHSENIDMTDKYLRENSDIKLKIDDLIGAYHEINDVIPQHIGKLFSGHIFPYNESFYDIECSYQLMRLCFYKNALISLRNSLELGLLSVYWDKDDKVEIDIQKWHDSIQDTPFRSEIVKGLLTIPTIKTFSEQFDLEKRIKVLYGELSNFNHTKGQEYSSSALNLSNFTRFNVKALNKYVDKLESVVQMLLTVHILKHPIALQYVPLDEKFGMNVPWGLCMHPWQVDLVKKVLPPDELKLLQNISDKDENAQEILDWINEHPDLTEEQFKKQVEDFNKRTERLKREGKWIDNTK